MGRFAQPDDEELGRKLNEQRQKEKAKIRALCEVIDEDGTGLITWNDFEAKIADSQVAAILSQSGLDVKHAEMFFRTLQHMSGEEMISVDAFVESCIGMQGNATSIDLHTLSIQLKRFEHQHRASVKRLYGKQRLASSG